MTCALHVSWDEKLTEYDFGPRHPMAPIRIKLTMELATAFGLLSREQVEVEAAPAASDAELKLVHDPEYIEAVRYAGRLWSEDAGESIDARRLLRHGLGTEDDPAFRDMHEASALVAGATLGAARAVWAGRARHGASIAGGLHHAMRDRASGFCIYNDPAIAIAWLLQEGAERIAYVDIDVHHGDGVQAAFWNDPRVLTISLHESPETLFPGTGRASETGGPDADGSAVNVALLPGTRDAGWLRAFDAIVPPLLRQFRPQILVSQHGCDTHWSDPLADLQLTIDAQRTAHAALHDLAHEVCEGRWLFTGGGGYQLVEVVPRSWTHLLAIAAGEPIDPSARTPQLWREYVGEVAVGSPPETMTEGGTGEFPKFEAGYDPAEPVDQAILATRNAVFPAYGMMPTL